MYIVQLLLLLGVLIFSGCAGFGVVESSNPDVKLWDAKILYSEQQRPLIAERLIFEAIDVYKERRDPHGLGHAYRTYAELLNSSSIVTWKEYYSENGFRDKTVTIDNRLTKSKEYATKALEYYKQAETHHRDAGRFDALTNVYFNMSNSYNMVDDRLNSCRALDQSLEANAENTQRNPSAEVNIPSGYKSYSELVDSAKKLAGCSNL